MYQNTQNKIFKEFFGTYSRVCESYKIMRIQKCRGKIGIRPISMSVFYLDFG